MRILPDNYSIRARYFPAVLSALPFFVIWFYLSKNENLRDLGSFLLNIKLFGISGISFSLVFLYFYSLMAREISMVFQRKYFTGQDAGGFPTVYLMMYADDTLSKSYKEKYRERVRRLFSFELLDKDQEESDVVEARKRLDEAAGLVRQHVKDGYLVLHHNVQFGFFRNFLGGTVVSMVFCVIGTAIAIVYLDSNRVMIFVLLILLGLYLSVFLFRKNILYYNGEAYAKQLFSEFIDGVASTNGR